MHAENWHTLRVPPTLCYSQSFQVQGMTCSFISLYHSTASSSITISQRYQASRSVLARVTFTSTLAASETGDFFISVEKRERLGVQVQSFLDAQRQLEEDGRNQEAAKLSIVILITWQFSALKYKNIPLFFSRRTTQKYETWALPVPRTR